MTHVIAIAGLVLLCAIWVVVQVMAGRGPRACKGDGQCELDANGEKTCRRECPKSNVVDLGTRSRSATTRDQGASR